MSDRRTTSVINYRSASAHETVAAMGGRRARQRVWPECFDSDLAAPPPLDIAAVIAYCEQRVPPHALPAHGGAFTAHGSPNIARTPDPRCPPGARARPHGDK